MSFSSVILLSVIDEFFLSNFVASAHDQVSVQSVLIDPVKADAGKMRSIFICLDESKGHVASLVFQAWTGCK